MASPNRNPSQKGPPFFFVFTRPYLHYNRVSIDDLSPPDAMPANRPNLTLDKQSFQGLLSAAFIIQEHNDRLKLAGQAPAEPHTHLEVEATSVCPHRGAPTPAASNLADATRSQNVRL